MANIICRPSHEVWQQRTGPALRAFLEKSFPQLHPLSDYVTEEVSGDCVGCECSGIWSVSVRVNVLVSVSVRVSVIVSALVSVRANVSVSLSVRVRLSWHVRVIRNTQTHTNTHSDRERR